MATRRKAGKAGTAPRVESVEKTLLTEQETRELLGGTIGLRRHEIKSWPEHFAASAAGLKPFEVRRNDRDYRVGDRITLHEWIPLGGGNTDGIYTGRTLEQDVIFITRNAIGLQEGYVSMGLAQVTPAT